VRIRSNPGVVRSLVVLLTVWLCGGAGCATGFVPSAGPAPIERFAYVIIESVPSGAMISVDDDEKGIAPVQVRIALTETGRTAQDMEVKLQWPDGRSDTTYRMPSDTTLRSEIRINANGMLVQ
jgi:hypothetical protein